jgi:hypothetical protein
MEMMPLSGNEDGGVMMFTACLPQHSQNPTRTNRSSGLIRNSSLLDKQMIIDNSCLGLANTQDDTLIKGN